MTDYRNKFLNNKESKALIDTVKKQELFNRNNDNLLKPTTSDDYLTQAESERFVKAFIKQKTRYIPEIDYTSPETFCFYGSAEKYYNDSVERIYKTYPYDGSKAEKMEWTLTASYMDLHILESEYPKETGHVVFSSDGWGSKTATSGDYGLSSVPQYIYFVGGPHSGTIFNSSKRRENNLKIDGTYGNTAEFWLKKSEFISSLTSKEVIFDVHTSGAISGSSTYGRFMVSLDSGVSSGSPFKLTYVSGTTGITDQVLGANITKASVADDAWHHYAITVLHSGSSLVSKLYVDGTLEDTNTESISAFGAVDRNFVGTIGSLATASNGFGKIGYGKLSASLDDFRYWKQARDERQIALNWFRPVHGGTDLDNTNPNLGLYYKFNEGIIGTETADKVVLDYSGRINNGSVTGWNSTFRSTVSAINSSTNLPSSDYTEPADPIINSGNSRVQAAISKLKNIGKSHDLQNVSSLANTVPSYFMLNDDTGLMGELIQIISSTLDDIFLKIKYLPKIKDYNYQDFFDKTGVHKNVDTNNFILGCEGTFDNEFNGARHKPWIAQILEHFGMVTTEIFAKSDLMETFLSRTEEVNFEQNLYEVKNAILSNIHTNLVHIYNTKGTERSFRNIIRCFGVDDELIKLNVYGNNEVYKIEKKPVYSTIKQKSLNFAGQNYQGTIYQTGSNKLYQEQRYFTGSTTPKPLTIEANVIFPDQNSLDSTFASSSLFGMHSVLGASGSNDALTWHTSDHASLQAYFVRRSETAGDGYFFLTSSNGTFEAISSSYIPDVYDTSHWNVSVRVAKKGDIDFGLNKLSGSGTYKVEFTGYNYDLDILKNSFYVTSSITRQEYENFSRLDRAVYAGSHKTNFSGSHLAGTDIRLLGLNVWLDGLSDDELQEHAKNPSIYGRRNPDHVSNFDDGENLRSIDSLVLRWQFENHYSSSAGGTLTVTDYTSGSAGTVSGSVVGYRYNGHAAGFPSTGSAIAQDFIPSVDYAPVDNVYSSDKVKIKNTELEKFEADSRPVTYFYSFEKSMYQVISKEMIKFFAGIVGMNNIIGEPINKYRHEYKGMEKLREKFFANVENDIDLDKFVEYYRWIDSSVSHFVQQLVPASAHFAGRIRDIVESHMLERNKYKYHLPTVEYKDPTVNPTNILGVNELLYDWEHGHAPTRFNQLVNNKAIQLGANGDTVDIPDSDDMSFTNGSGTDKPFTISAWVYVGDIAADSGVIMSRRNSVGAGNQDGEWIIGHTNGGLYVILYADPAQNGVGTFSTTNRIYFNDTGTKLSSATWHFVTVTYDGSENTSGLKVYKDGTQITPSSTTTKTNYSGMPNFNIVTTIGGTDSPTTNTFEDFIADIVVFDKALSQAEITEAYNSGKVKDMSTFSAYSNIISWYKMGDDLDTAGSGGIRDYVSTNHGTLAGAAAIVTNQSLASDIETVNRQWNSSRPQDQNCLWQKDRSERADDGRDTINRIRVSDVSGSTYAIRRFSRPYRFGVEQSRPVKAGFNRKTNKDPNLYKLTTKAGNITLDADRLQEFIPCTDQVVPDEVEHYSGPANVQDNDSYLDADSDMMFPFTMISSSAGIDLDQFKDNMKIANNHLDVGLHGEQTLQSPFVRQHVGGMPHRKVEVGITSSLTRPEAYHLTAAANQLILTSASLSSPKSMFHRDVGGQLNYVFKNIQHTTASSILGNYNKDYEIVQTTGRSQNNRQFVDDDGFSYTTTVASNLSGPVDFAIPTRRKNSHIIVNKFSSPGSPETQAAFASDQESEEFSIYNTVNYRNSTVREVLNKLSAEQSDQFGYRSGSSTQASIHMANRNPSRQTGSLGKDTNFDNNYIRHPIPQSDYQYSWVTASVGDSVYDFLARNNNMGHTSDFKLINSKYTRDFSSETSGSVPSDFVTNYSQRTASYVNVNRVQTVRETTPNPSYRFGSQVSISDDVLVVVNEQGSVTYESGNSTIYVFRSSSQGYVEEFSTVVAVSDEAWGIGGHADDTAVVTSITNHGSWFACAVSGGVNSPTPDCIKIFRSSSSGWALNESLSGSAISFKGISRIAMTASSAGVYRIAALNTGSVRIFTHHSASGWYNSGNNVTDLTSITTYKPHVASTYYQYGYMDIHGDLNSAGSRIVVGNSSGFSVLVSGSGWSEEDTIVPSDWSYKPSNGATAMSFGLYPFPTNVQSSYHRNNMSLYGSVFALITSTSIYDATLPNYFGIPKIQIWKESGGSWSLYEEKDASTGWADFSDYEENSNQRIPSIALDNGLLFLGVTERDILFDGAEYDFEATEQDYGSVYVYADNGTSYQKQTELFSNEPVLNLGLGNSLVCKGGKLAAGGPSNSGFVLHRNPVQDIVYRTEDASVTVFEYEQTGQTDLSLRGPKIIGSADNTAFGFVGRASYFGEVSQVPLTLSGEIGKKLRVIEKQNLISVKLPEFSIELEYIQGSPDSEQLSNSSFGLDATPSGPILVQYKLGTGPWKDSSIHITKGDTDKFTKVKSRPIANAQNKKIGVRILNVTSDSNSNEWGFKNINIVPSRESYDSSSQLVKKTTSRNNTVKKVDNTMPSLYFNGYFQEISGAVPNGHGIYFTEDGRGGDDRPFSVQMWLKPEVQLSGERNVFAVDANYYVNISSSVSNPQHLDLKFVLFSASNNGYQPYNQYRLGIKKESGIKNNRWSHIVATYNGTKDFSGFSLYVNGEYQFSTEKEVSIRSNYDYTGMAGAGTDGENPPGSAQNRNIGFGLPVNYTYSSTATGGTLAFLAAYQGYISNFAIFDKELTRSEVSDLYGLRDNVSDYTIAKGDPLNFKNSQLFSSNTLTWFPFTGVGSGSVANQHDVAYTDQLNGQITLRAPNRPTEARYGLSLMPVMARTKWEVPNTSDKYVVNSETNTITGISSTGSYLQNALSPYSWPTWKQIRGSENPITKKHIKENTISISVRGAEVFPSPRSTYNFSFTKKLSNVNDSLKRSVDRKVQNYSEPMVTDRFAPMTLTLHDASRGGLNYERIRIINEDQFLSQKEEESSWNFEDDTYSLLTSLRPNEAGVAPRPVDGRLLLLRKTYQNDMTKFANPDLNEVLKLDELYNHEFDKLLISTQRSVSPEDGVTIEMNYVENIFPREENAYLQKVRLRESFDFFGWRDDRSDRTVLLSGSNVYGDSLVQAGVAAQVYPEITNDLDDHRKTNSLFVDAVDSNSTQFPTRYHHIESSSWPLDAREDFTTRPLSITSSYFVEGEDFMDNRIQGTFGEGTLQNDYSIFGLGINALHGTPPPAPLYNRRIPQVYGSNIYLAGEAKWEAPVQASVNPFAPSYRDHRESIRLLGQDHSIVPEFRISEFVEDTVQNHNGNYDRSRNIAENYLSLTGALYQNANGDVTIGSNFFKTYATSDFMKYFGAVLENISDEGASNDIDPLKLTLKCQAAMKFTPYYGFYPAERVMQISKLFAKGYMSEVNINNTREDSRLVQTNFGILNLVRRKIRANLQQSIKPLFAPGILFNSIKSGLAVDYPLFGSTADFSTVKSNFASAIGGTQLPMTSFHSSLQSLNLFTGSVISDTVSSAETGIPRLSGSVYRRVSFEDLLNPDRLAGLEILDNEPHPSASIYYGNSETSRIFDYPFTFGDLDKDRTERLLNAADFSVARPLAQTLLPYKMAINNFCAETVKFFLEDSKVSTFESEEVEVRTEANTDYKMRVYLRNKDLTMYDRHSAFGPPVDEGKNVTFSQYVANTIINSGSSATRDFGFAAYNFDLPSGSAVGTITGMSFTGSNGGNGSIRFVKSSSEIPGTSTNITSTVVTSQRTYSVSKFGDLYIKDKKCYIDLSSIKSKYTNIYATRQFAGGRLVFDNNRSSALASLVAAAASVLSHKSGSGVAASAYYELETNRELYPPAVSRSKSTRYYRKSLRLYQTGAAASAGQSWAPITQVIASVSQTNPQDDMSHFFSSFSGSTVDFTGGTNQTTKTAYTIGGTTTKNHGHGFAPFHPPFLDKNAQPYVDITYRNSSAGTFGLDEIWENCTFTYYNFQTPPSNANTSNTRKNNANYNHAMSLSASIDLKEFVQYERTEDDGDASRQNRKRWVIQTKWETPVIQFSNVTASALRLDNGEVYQTSGSPWQDRTWTRYYSSSVAPHQDYLTASVGMWHQYGTTPDSNEQGYELAIEDSPDLAPEYQLAKLLGFTSNNVSKRATNTGIVSEEKQLSEAVVAIPYYTTDKGRVQFLNLNEETLEPAKLINKKLKEQLANGDLTRQEYDRRFENPSQDKKGFTAYQLRMMEKYVIPPQFDFYSYPDLAKKQMPMMYIFQFRAKMNNTDLANIWQNISPTSAASAAKARYSSIEVNTDMFDLEADVQYVSHFLDLDKTVMSNKSRKHFFQNDIRWLVFKVKMRAEKDLAKVKRDSLPGIAAGKRIINTSLKDSGYFYKGNSIDPVRNENQGIEGLKLKHSFNWPYDYFSIVELVKIGAKVDFLPKTDDQRD